jgi:hypothetical protein
VADEIDLGRISKQVRNLAIAEPMKHSVLLAGLSQNAGSPRRKRLGEGRSLGKCTKTQGDPERKCLDFVSRAPPPGLTIAIIS